MIDHATSLTVILTLPEAEVGKVLAATVVELVRPTRAVPAPLARLGFLVISRSCRERTVPPSRQSA